MKTRSITRLLKLVDYTTDYTSFDVRLRFAGIDNQYTPFLWDLYRLLRFTDFTPEHVKEVFNSDNTYSDVADKFELSVGSIKTEVHNFSKKLAEIFQGDILEDILDKKDIDHDYFRNVELIVMDSLERREIDLKGLSGKVFTVDILNVNFKKEELPEINTEEFLSLRNKIVSFSIPSQKFVYDNMPQEHKAYVSYLLNTPSGNLTEADKQRREEILKFCKIEA